MPTETKIKRVVFVQKFVPHYRLPLFELLKTKLAQQNIEFILIYGRPDPYEGSKIKMAFPDWGVKVKSWIIPLPGRYLYLQGSPRFVKKGDVVIVEHASKLLDNYVLYFLEQINFLHMCYFGHGKNFQDNHELKIAKYIKELMLKRVSRWFAYSKMSVDSLVEQGVDENIIVSVNNTLIHQTNLSEDNIDRNPMQCIYIGGLYADKRIDFIIEASSLIQQQHPDFILKIVGTGPESEFVENFAQKHDWCIYEGPQYGDDRDRLLFESSLMFMPSAVGLAAIDSFHFATPIVTTADSQHGPEVAYLEHHKNALVLEHNCTPQKYAEAVIQLLKNEQRLSEFRQNCRAAAKQYTIENTADRFVNGILSLSANKHDTNSNTQTK